jgi:monoterpene epsilon-lactone hydrolase
MSWQARLLMIVMRVQRFFTLSATELDVAKDRADAESFVKIFKTLGKVDITPVNADGVPAAWIVPTGPVTERVILYAHGGSYNAGSISSHIPLTSNIALATKSRLLAIDYRLAPEHVFPAAVDDALAAYRWLLAQNIDPKRIVVAGDSAGGGLVLALLLALRDKAMPLPAAAVCLSAWTDLTCSGESWTKNAKADFMLNLIPTVQSVEIYLGDVDPRTPLASPLFGDLRGLPPILMQVGSNETILSDSTLFAEKAKSAGVDVTLEVWKDMQHEWQYAASWLPEGRQALARIGEFVSQHCPD